MGYGFSLIVRGADATADKIATMAERAEALGIDALWLSAHVILPPQERSGYVMVPGRQHPEFWKQGYWEPMTLTAFLAARTRRIHLGTSIVVLPMHNPIEMAKQVAQVDQLSGGRFTFGVGVGWFAEEFEVLGRDFHDRGRRTDEALEMMQVLWRDEPATFHGRYHSFETASFLPKPVQQPRPPIWVAGNSEPAMRRAARYADAWHPVRTTPEQLDAAKTRLGELVEQAGRPAGAVALAAKCPMVFQDGPPGEEQFPTQGRPQDIVDAVKRYQDVGVSDFVFDIIPESLEQALTTMDRFAQEVRPKL